MPGTNVPQMRGFLKTAFHGPWTAWGKGAAACSGLGISTR